MVVESALNTLYIRLLNRTLSTYYQPLISEPAIGKTTYTYDKENRLTKINKDTAFTYDVRGNLLTKTGSTYAWNVRNLLTTVTTGGSTYTYKYDPLGSRIARIIGSSETRYVVAGGGAPSRPHKTGAQT